MKKSDSDAPFVLQNMFKNGGFKMANRDTVVGIVFTIFHFLIREFSSIISLSGFGSGSWSARYINTWCGTVACPKAAFSDYSKSI
jgi:hypothetical protein